MESKDKKKILLVVGAGGSVETGYPSVSQLNKIIENKLEQSDEKLSRLYTIIKNILINKEDKKKRTRRDAGFFLKEKRQLNV